MNELDRLKASHPHWFSRSTMRFFGCRVSSRFYIGAQSGDVYFVTSEASANWGQPRRYSVRRGNDGDIRTLGDFHSIDSARKAHSIARRAAAEETES